MFMLLFEGNVEDISTNMKDMIKCNHLEIFLKAKIVLQDDEIIKNSYTRQTGLLGELKLGVNDLIYQVYDHEIES